MLHRFWRHFDASYGLRIGGAVGTFFGLKLVTGLLLIGVSTAFLSISGFVTFSQLFLFFALLSTISAAGVQNGLTRQIAVARADAATERRAAAAAIRIWAIASLITLVVAALLRRSVSELLVGDASLAPIVPLVAFAAVGGGLGILACAVLNGRRRGPTSLLLQSSGLAIGGLLCVWSWAADDPVGAVLGYAAGPLSTSVLATLVTYRAGIRVRSAGEGLGQEVRLLLGYSASFLAIAVIMPSTLFALRHVYRETFGIGLLGYWLVANRVSDVTSQILGLYMAQIFLPQAAHETDPDRTRHLLVRTMLIGSAIMLGGWAVFTLGAPFFISTFLSAAYLPAAPFIGGYLLGDGLRVTSSLTTHFMLARGRLAASVGMEVATAALLTLYLIGLAHLGRPEAPYWAYPAAYATMAVLLVAAFAWRRPQRA
jgi:O-antigen/teichoic acid export membrane protein